MKRFALIMLAGTALAPAAAIAEERTVAPPVKWEDTPKAQMRMPAGTRPVVQSPMVHAPIKHQPMVHAPQAHGPKPHAPMSHPPQHGQMQSAPHHMGAGRPPVIVQHRGPGEVHVRSGDRVVVRHLKRDGGGMRGHHGFKNYSNYRRIDRGFVLPQPWWGQGYHLQNWSMYGLPQPIHGGRWVRYYDDALMIDGHGRVHDGRYGMSWDEWQDQWAYDDRGVPVYSGDGDYYPGDRDYAWVEGDRGYAEAPPPPAYGHSQGYAYAPPPPCAQACAYGPGYAPAYGYAPGYAYGYGYGYGHAAAIVTETTVTITPHVVRESWVEEEVVYEKAAPKARKKYRAKPRYHRPKPQPGERG